MGGRRERPELENLLIEIFLIPNLNPRDPSLDNLNELCYEYLDLLEKKALAYAAERDGWKVIELKSSIWRIRTG